MKSLIKVDPVMKRVLLKQIVLVWISFSSWCVIAAPGKILPANPVDDGSVAKEEAWSDNRWNQMDVGQFVSSSLPVP
ncbi:MAG: hypothetical protein ABIQ35_07190, partial [Verrucomicrobiota bacterium]